MKCRTKEERIKTIYDRVTKNDNGCLEWHWGLSHGYAYLSYQNKAWRGHRLVWHLLKGEIPKGLVVMHKCDNRRCLNIDHLQLGTQQQNHRDMMIKHRNKKTPRIVNCKRGHLMAGDNLIVKFNHGVEERFCRECKNLYQRNYLRKIGKLKTKTNKDGEG